MASLLKTLSVITSIPEFPSLIIIDRISTKSTIDRIEPKSAIDRIKPNSVLDRIKMIETLLRTTKESIDKKLKELSNKDITETSNA